MNRDEKSVAIAEIAEQIDGSQAIFALDYRGLTVEQAAELRAKLRAADATFRVVKNSLTERAADQAGAAELKDHLSGPTALTFVRGDIAVAAKAVSDYARETELLPFKGGLMEGQPLDVAALRSLARLPSREVLYGQLVGVVASPIGGLVRSLGGLLGGLAAALGQVQTKMEAGEIGSAAAAASAPPDAGGEAVAAEAPTEAAESGEQSEPEQDEPAESETNEADVVAEGPTEDAATDPTKEDE